MRRSLVIAFLLVVASPLGAAPLVKRLVAAADHGAYWRGACPHQFDFSTEITSRHPGDLTIQWLRSDGAATPTETLHFNHANEVRTVFDHWTLNRDYRGWEQLRATDGANNTSLSRRVSFTIRCR